MGAGIGLFIKGALRGIGGAIWEFVRAHWKEVLIGVAILVAAVWIWILQGRVADRDATIREKDQAIESLKAEALQYQDALTRGEEDRRNLATAIAEAKAATARAGADVGKAFTICARQIERLRMIDKAVGAVCPPMTSCSDGAAPEAPVSSTDPLINAANNLFEWGR